MKISEMLLAHTEMPHPECKTKTLMQLSLILLFYDLFSDHTWHMKSKMTSNHHLPFLASSKERNEKREREREREKATTILLTH